MPGRVRVHARMPISCASMRRETEGNPFFVREICSHVHEIGAANAGGGFTLETLGVPDGVKQVIGRRVEHLPEAAGRALSAAAVIGREFDLDLLIEITGDDEDALLDLLDEAVAARVVEETSMPGRYSFLHAPDPRGAPRRAERDAPGAASPSGRARDRASACGSARRLSRRARVPLRGCAAATRTKAVEYAERAGEQSLRRLAHEEAAQYFERGLALEPPRPAPPGAISCSGSPKRCAAPATSPVRARRVHRSRRRRPVAR